MDELQQFDRDELEPYVQMLNALSGYAELQHVCDALTLIAGTLSDIAKDALDSGNKELLVKLKPAYLLVNNLAPLFDKNSASGSKLVLQQWKRGPKPNGLVWVMGMAAGNKVQDLINTGVKTEAAVAEIMAETGMSRSRLFGWLNRYREYEGLVISDK